jgi:uncharacterized protein (DUF1330 family)
MIIGIAGCQRTGKTYAAKVIAEKLGLEYVATDVSSITSKYPTATKNFTARMKCQEEILSKLESLLTKDNIVLDRTPIDLMVYTMDAYHWGNVNAKNEKKVQDYCKRVLTLVSKFDIMILTEMLDTVVEDSTKAPTNKMYMQKIDHMMASFGNYHYILKGGSYETRNESIESIIERIRSQRMVCTTSD